MSVYCADEPVVGLPTFGQPNSFWNKALYSYIPIVIGTVMEPALASIGAANCMLGPYQALLEGRGTAKSLTIDYDKSPPHFQFMRSVKAKNFKLAALSMAILLANLFAVALTGLFSPIRIPLEISTRVSSPSTLSVAGEFLDNTHDMYYLLVDHLSHARQPPEWTSTDYYIIPFSTVDNDVVESHTGTTMGLGVDIKCSIVPSADITLTWFNGTNQVFDGPEMPSNYVATNDPCWTHQSKPILEPEITNTRYGWRPPNHDALLASTTCPGTLFALWLERPAQPHPVDHNDRYAANIEIVMLKCTTIEIAVQLTANITKDNQVQSITNIQSLDPNQQRTFYPGNSMNVSLLASTFLSRLVTGTLTEPDQSRHQIRWINHLMALMNPSIVNNNPTNITHIPNTAGLVDTFEDLYRWLFAINVGLYAQDIISTGADQITPATAVMMSEKFEVSPFMFYLAIGILGFMVGVLVVLYSTQQQYVVGHLPTSLAAMYAHLYASNSQEECGRVEGRNSEERGKALEALGLRYSYGWFPGGGHVGVYREKMEDETPDRSRLEKPGTE